MTRDEPLPLEPSRGLSPAGTAALVGLLAFLAGIAAMALVVHFYGGGLWHATPAAPVASTPAPQPSPTAMPAPEQGMDVATLSSREQALAGRLDQIEARLNIVDSGSRTAAGYATRAEALMTAFAVRRAIERGLPLGPLEIQLRRRFGETQPGAVATIVRVAAEPVTREDLSLALEAIAPRLATGGPDEGLWSRLRRLASDLIVLRQSDTPSPRPADRLKRARRALDEGQVEVALAEVAHMPGAENAQSWIAAAKRYVAGRDALNTLEIAALQGPIPGTPAPRTPERQAAENK
ncbi:MAG: hypothetical protein ACOY45_13450 [Pseudomonadota bacterium]